MTLDLNENYKTDLDYAMDEILEDQKKFEEEKASAKEETTEPEMPKTKKESEVKKTEGKKKKTKSDASSELKSYLLKIPADLHRSVRVLAAYKDISISDYILDSIEEKVKSDKKKHNLEI